MSRTVHKVNRSSSTTRSRLTKGKRAGRYSAGALDLSEQTGGGKGHDLWLKDYLGYGKQKKRRRIRKVMKRHGRRAEKRRRPPEE